MPGCDIAYDVRRCCHKHIDETFREWMDGMTHIKLLYDWHWNRNGKAYGGGASIIWMLHNWTGTVRVCVCYFHSCVIFSTYHPNNAHCGDRLYGVPSEGVAIVLKEVRTLRADSADDAHAHFIRAAI